MIGSGKTDFIDPYLCTSLLRRKSPRHEYDSLAIIMISFNYDTNSLGSESFPAFVRVRCSFVCTNCKACVQPKDSKLR